MATIVRTITGMETGLQRPGSLREAPLMSLLAFLLRTSRGVVVLSVLAGLTGGICGVSLIALIQGELARNVPEPTAMVWAFGALCLVTAGARVVGQVGMVKLGQRAVADLGLYIVRRTLELPLREFEALDTSALLAALTEDVVLIANAMIGIPFLCTNIPIVIACFAYIGWLSPAIFACGLIFAALAIAAYVALSSRGAVHLRRAREHQDALVGHFRTLIGGFRELKIHRGRRAAYLTESVEPTMASVRGDLVRGLRSFAIADGWSQLALFGFIGVLLFAAPRLQPIERPTLISAVLVVLYLMTPLDTIVNWLPVLGRARASLLKVESLVPALERHPDGIVPPPTPEQRIALRDTVSLEAARYSYGDGRDDGEFVLGPVELTIRRGAIVILAGGNGSGKTTLVKLISGLYAPQAGIFRVDGHAIAAEDREAYRQLVSVVFADGHLFGDLRGLGRDGIDDLARNGLRELGLDGHVSVDGGVFSTTDLSQGQRRRLALLGACLEDRPIVILDEWAANQDPSFKRYFYHTLLPELRAMGKALLVISHDEDYFEIADRVVRLRDGCVLEESSVGLGGAWA
jgi:putative pyoverdin transport system ATP-binding/permease protein